MLKVGDKVRTKPDNLSWRKKYQTILGVVDGFNELGGVYIRVTTPDYPVSIIIRHPSRVSLASMSREERIAEQAALVEERERVLAETKKSLEEARKVLAELTAPEPPKVGDLASREGVVRAVIKWRLGTMVITAFQGAYPQEESDIPMVHHWSSKTGKLYSTWQEARDAS